MAAAADDDSRVRAQSGNAVRVVCTPRSIGTGNGIYTISPLHTHTICGGGGTCTHGVAGQETRHGRAAVALLYFIILTHIINMLNIQYTPKARTYITDYTQFGRCSSNIRLNLFSFFTAKCLS